MDPSTPLVQAAADICFNANSFYVIGTAAGTLTGCISTLFGLLMLSYRSRIQTAEKREQEATTSRDAAVAERNEALWRLDNTRGLYRQFAEETHALTSGPNDGHRRPRYRDG